MIRNLWVICWLAFVPAVLWAQQPVPVKPRILISTDIGGTDPDDNQSMAHFLMYSNLFTTEGLVSSPSYGNGTKQHLLDMIGLYEQDLPKLAKHAKAIRRRMRCGPSVSRGGTACCRSRGMPPPLKALTGSSAVPANPRVNRFGYWFGVVLTT